MTLFFDLPPIILPPVLSEHLLPLFQAWPLADAMPDLVVEKPQTPDLTGMVARLSAAPILEGKLEIQAGLWLYVDYLDRAHAICQAHEDKPTFNYWHAILHRREGDFSNSHYWFRRVGDHPAMHGPEQLASYDPHQFIELVQKASAPSSEPNKAQESQRDLVNQQRREWVALFAWCCEGLA